MLSRQQSLKPIEIGKVLLASRGRFVGKQIGQADHGNRATVHFVVHAVPPGRFKLQAIYIGNEIDTVRRSTNLKNQIGREKILFLDAGERGSEPQETTLNSLDVLWRRANPNIDVFGGPGIAVVGNSESTHDQELSVLV